jgi:mRNA interferase MazF
MTKRGDVIIVDFPFSDAGQSKVRPAVVVQNDKDNLRIRKTVIAMVTGNLRRRGDASHLFVDPKNAEGASSGLGFPSLISCYNLFTVEQVAIMQTIGQLSSVLKQKLNDCLKAALELQ